MSCPAQGGAGGGVMRDIVILGGPNGAGKTTLLRLLAGLETPDTGKIAPGHGLSLGYYAQEHETLETERTVLDHMRTAAPNLTESQPRKVLGSFLFSGDDVEKPAGVLSGGEKTRLALALLVVSGANVLLLDEPTASLDPDTGDWVRTWLERYRDESGCTILLASHNMAEVERLCSHVLMLKQGRIVDRGSPRELLDRYGREDMEEVFLDIARGRRQAETAG